MIWNNLSKDRKVESQEDDTPIVNPPRCGLPKGRFIEINNRDIPRVHHYLQDEGNILQEELAQRKIGNPPQSGPPQRGLQQKIRKIHHGVVHQSGSWHSRTT